MNNERDFSKIPAGACTLVVGEVELGDNGDGAKSAPVSLIARSGKPIEHAYWGRVVHDFDGMHLHKSKLTIDYVHDSKEIIGYLNKFSTETGDLVASGALVPFKDSDRATEIIHKSKAGIPYEASINFGGDGIMVQEVEQGQMAPVNGYDFEGPGIIIREWPLRGVAICPYGADMNTDSTVLSSSSKQFSATVVTTPKTTSEETEMRDKGSVEVVAAEVAEVEEVVSEAVELEAPVEEVVAEAAVEEVVEQAVEAETAPEGEPEQEIKPEMSRADFIAIVDEFGTEVAVQNVRDGGDYASALRLAYSNEKQAREAAEAKAAELAASKGGTPVPVVAAPEKKNTGLFKC